MQCELSPLISLQLQLSLENLIGVFQEACTLKPRAAEESSSSAIAANRVACLFTKSPETLMVLCSTEREGQAQFLVFDSHPRPENGLTVRQLALLTCPQKAWLTNRLLAMQGCSIVVYKGVRALARALLQRLPVTDLPDLGTMEREMLNTFSVVAVSVGVKPHPVTTTNETAECSNCVDLKRMIEKMARKMDETHSLLLAKVEDCQSSIKRIDRKLQISGEFDEHYVPISKPNDNMSSSARNREYHHSETGRMR